MKFLFLFSAMAILNVSSAYAATGSYDVPDGPTAPEATISPVSPSLGTASIAMPEETESGVTYDPVSRTPPCPNSTCITPQTIFTAQHGYVQDTPVKSYISLLLPPDGEDQACQTPTLTGAEIYRTIYDDSVGQRGQIEQYDDAFCINQGCVYFGRRGDIRCE